MCRAFYRIQFYRDTQLQCNSEPYQSLILHAKYYIIACCNWYKQSKKKKIANKQLKICTEMQYRVRSKGLPLTVEIILNLRPGVGKRRQIARIQRVFLKEKQLPNRDGNLICGKTAEAEGCHIITYLQAMRQKRVKDLFAVTLVFVLSCGFFSFKLTLISNVLFLPQIPTCSTMPVDF